MVSTMRPARTLVTILAVITAPSLHLSSQA